MDCMPAGVHIGRSRGRDRVNATAAVIAIAGFVLGWPDAAAAQPNLRRFELGVQMSSAISGQFDSNDVGIGGRLSWQPVPGIGIESELNLYPGDFPDRPSFSRARVEGLFGITAGPAFDRVRPFARLRSGFLSIRAAPHPYACILIYPPPLSCELAAGRTLPIIDIGGGVELFATRIVFVRIDVGDRVLRYPAPVFDNDRTRRDDPFLGHDFRFAAGTGLRF